MGQTQSFYDFKVCLKWVEVLPLVKQYLSRIVIYLWSLRDLFLLYSPQMKTFDLILFIGYLFSFSHKDP